MRPEQPDVDAEIKALIACKAYVPKYTAFGDNNHATIDAQIEYLRSDIELDTPAFDELTPEERGAIMDAVEWLDGERDQAPSSDWNQFKPKAKGHK